MPPVAKLGTGFVANNPLSNPPTLLHIIHYPHYPTLPSSPHTALKCSLNNLQHCAVAAIIPPTFSGSGGDLKAGLPIFFTHSRQNFQARENRPLHCTPSALFPWILVIDFRAQECLILKRNPVKSSLACCTICKIENSFLRIQGQQIKWSTFKLARIPTGPIYFCQWIFFTLVTSSTVSKDLIF